MDKLREETKGMAKSEEDVLSYALFPQVAPQFFKERDGQKEVPKEKVKKPAGLSASNPGERVLIVEDLTA